MKKMITHNFTATFQEGIVSQIDPKTHRIKAILPALEDLETAWLPFITPNSGGNQFYALPDVGELVAMVLDAQGENGYVLGTIYNEQDPVPVSDAQVWLKQFSNGTKIAHNRNTGEVIVHTTGKVVITASQVEITAPCKIVGDVTIEGNLKASGKITSAQEVSAPSIKQGSISLGSHVHTGVESGNKRSGKPQ